MNASFPAKGRLALCAVVSAAGALLASPLQQTTAVQTLPDPAAPAITYLKAGTEPVPSSSGIGVPDGWMAVDVPGPFTAFVRNQDLTKDLNVKPGSNLYFRPGAESGVLTALAAGDKTTITGLQGTWTQVRLDKSLVGYIHPGPFPTAAESRAMQAPAPVAPATEPGKPAPPDASGQALPANFEGRFVSTRSNPLSPRRPYDWQLVDANGARLVFLDVGRLLLTEQIDKYVGHQVQAFGTPKPVPGGKDIVVVVESLQLK